MFFLSTLPATSSLLTLVMLLFTGTNSAANEPTRFYLVGNSLTWDTVPSRLDGDAQWHVDCGKSLPYIVEHLEEPCVKTSTLWPAALKEKQYDVISLQVHYGSTLAQDVAAISQLIKNQPRCGHRHSHRLGKIRRTSCRMDSADSKRCRVNHTDEPQPRLL